MRKSKRIEAKAVNSPTKPIVKKRRKGGLEKEEEAAISSLLQLATPTLSPEHSSTSTLSLPEFLAEFDNTTGHEVVLDGTVLRDISAFTQKVKKAFERTPN